MSESNYATKCFAKHSIEVNFGIATTDKVLTMSEYFHQGINQIDFALNANLTQNPVKKSSK